MLDLSNKKKNFFALKLTDGTALNILLPKKRVFEKIVSMNNISLDDASPEDIDEIYEVVAEILSSNTQKKKYTVNQVGEMLDFEDINLIFKEYGTFVGCVLNDPN